MIYWKIHHFDYLTDMLNNFHTSTGAIAGIIITQQTDNSWLAIPSFFIGVIVHHLGDMLGEKSSSLKETLVMDGVFTGILLILLFDYWTNVVVISTVLGSVFPDLVDKFRHFILKKSQIFPCHQSYWPTYQLSLNTTWLVNALAGVLMILTLILIR